MFYLGVKAEKFEKRQVFHKKIIPLYYLDGSASG
jgi:hypothetical protein